MSFPNPADTPHAGGDLLEEATRAIAVLDAHPDDAVRAAAKTLLAGVDTVHRTGLTHLVAAIQGLAGAYDLGRPFLQALRRRCDEVGALLIFDEVQCGVGRCGEPDMSAAPG